MGETIRSASLQRGNASASSLPALLLLYDITSKMSFDNIRVSALRGLGTCFSPGVGGWVPHMACWVFGQFEACVSCERQLFWPDPAGWELIPGAPGWVLRGWVSLV